MSVSELSSRLKRTVEDAFGLVRIRGEISGWKRVASGHCYLALKDDKAVIDAVMWKGSTSVLAFAPTDGIEEFAPEELPRFKPVRQRLVRVHPSTGKKSIYLSSHAGRIVGWQVPEALAFLGDLTERATQREFVYSHTWRVGDLVMWDNQQTMHRARPFPENEPRDVRRTTLMGSAPTVEQQAA